MASKQDIYLAKSGNPIKNEDRITIYGNRIYAQQTKDKHIYDDITVLSGLYDNRFDEQRYYTATSGV